MGVEHDVAQTVVVSVVTELPDILGTGGGLQAVAGDMAPSFVVLNGDILHDVDLGALLEAMPEGGACMALRPDEQKRYGAVLADESQRVVRLVDLAQAEASGAVRDGTHFTGIHAMSRRSLESLDPGFSCIVRTVYSELVPQRQVAAHAHDGLWLDVGDPAAYLAANRAVLHGDIDHIFDPFRAAAYARSERGEVGRGTGAHIDGAAWIGPGAAVGGATIRESIVGADAVVAEGAQEVRRRVAVRRAARCSGTPLPALSAADRGRRVVSGRLGPVRSQPQGSRRLIAPNQAT